MNKKLKLIIPLALALAAVVSVGTAVQAAGFEGLKLNEDQKETLREARSLHHSGGPEEALEFLENSNLPDEIIQKIKDRHNRHEAIREAVENEDYDSFRDLVEDDKLGQIIDTEEEFEKFVEAHDLREAGDKEGARKILDELGIRPHGPQYGPHGPQDKRGPKGSHNR